VYAASERSSPPRAVGLVGCGHVARRYAQALAGDAGGGLRLTCATDVEPDRGSALCAEFGLRFVPDLDRLLARAEVAVVCVCTPNASHAPLAARCLEAGKHVVLEHPMAMSAGQAEALRATARCADRRLFVVRQRRYQTTVQALRSALWQRRLGALERVRMSLCWHRGRDYFEQRPWRRTREAGGVVVNQASHFLDILLYLFGAPAAVEGSLGTIRHDIDCEDAARGTIRFRRGPTVTFECTTAAPERWTRASLEVEGSGGRMALGGTGWERFALPAPEDLAAITAGAAGPLTGDHAGFLDRVKRKLAGERIEVVDADEGLRAVRLIDAIYARFARRDRALREHFDRVFAGAPA
jgi:predicted dehydrogenase